MYAKEFGSNSIKAALSQNMFKIPQKSGACERPLTASDYRYRDLIRVGAVDTKFDWKAGHNTEDRDKIKLSQKDQGDTLSCVGQSWSLYAEYLNFLETGFQNEMAAKWIYGQIALAGGGAYITSGAELGIKVGFVHEKSVPSYENGNPPSEMFMIRKVDITEMILREARNYQAFSYFYVDAYNIDEMALAIKNHGLVVFGVYGDNAGWQNGDVTPPDWGGWGHAIVGKGAIMRMKKKAIIFQNSWGKYWGFNGDGYINEDYFNKKQTFNAMVLVDKRNTMATFVKLVKEEGITTVYILDLEGYYHAIQFQPWAFSLLGKTWDDIPVETVKSIPKDKIGHQIGFIAVNGH